MTCWHFIRSRSMLGSKGAPVWFLWVHLILNGLMVLPFGGLLERKRGSRQVLIVFVTATALSSIVFHLLTQGQDIQATGISAVGYAFVTGGVMLLPNVWKEFSRTVKLFYLFLIFSIWPHALTSNHRMDLNTIASFRDCELSIGLYRK